MFIEYLKRADAKYTHWNGHVTGVSVCRFTVPELSEKQTLLLPKWEAQSAIEIFFCTGGQAIVNLAGTAPRKVERHHIFVLMGTMELHSVKISQELQGFLVAIEKKQMRDDTLPVCAALGLQLDLCRLQQKLAAQHSCALLSQTCWTKAVFDFLTNLSEETRGQYCLLKAVELLYMLDAQHTGAEQWTNLGENLQTVQCALDVRTYLEQHLSEKITIDDLCRKFSVSPTYLKTAFRRMYGSSIHRWLIDLRMRQAGEWICCTERPIYQIARDVGYEGMSQFSAAFRKYYGTTPSEFKKMSKTAMLCPF